ncbi:MAG: glycine/sarcosine/betaine reductase component B subunit [Lachnospiraceae bacterium]|jgi:glycine reductase|nr:glycine/sarcosine/betaine reductase component B subunit [Lachnospiraceae bacterium]
MSMRLTRKIYPVRELREGDKCEYSNCILTVNYDELLQVAKPYSKNIAKIWFEVYRPGEDARIVHVMDTIQPMIKTDTPPEWGGKEYPGILNYPYTVGMGTTNVLEGFTVMECAALPWDDSASSGLLYVRDAIIQTTGFYRNYTPFCDTINLILNYEMAEGKSAEEYDNDIRKSAMAIAQHLAKLTIGLEPDREEVYDNTAVDGLPKVALVWMCQNQGVFADTLFYGLPIDNMVPTLLEPNEMLDGAVVGGNLAWPAFKIPTWIHVNGPILKELYRRHGVDLNFAGVILARSHQPSNWHKDRCSQSIAKMAAQIGCEGLIMQWEGGGNAAIDGMLTVQNCERRGIKASTLTFEFGGKDGTEGQLLVDDVPEANAVVSCGSWERTVKLDAVKIAYGGKTMRLDKEKGGYFPDATQAIEFDTSVHMYMSGNQSGYSKITAHAY